MKASRDRKNLLVGISLIAPSMACLIAFYFYPIIYTIYLSFLEWNLLSPRKTFIGLSNYTYIWQDERFLQVFKNSVIFTVGVTFFSIFFGLILALALVRQTKINNFFRALYFAPYIVSWVSVSLLWRWIFDFDWGLLNSIVKLFHLTPLNYLGDPQIALYSLIFVMVWKIIGYDMVIFLAGLRNIPMDYYEAADIDGSSKWNSFRFITIPLLSPTMLFLLVTSMIISVTSFTIIKAMTGGGPVGSTSIFVYYIYEVAFEYFKIGQASAAVLIFFIMIIGLILIQFLGLRKYVHYER